MPDLHGSVPSTTSVSLLYSSTQGRTTAAIVPSCVFPGVDIVIYETVDDQLF